MADYDPRTLQRCEAANCPQRDRCQRFTLDWHPAQPGIADYSRRADFDPKSCPKHLPTKEPV